MDNTTFVPTVNIDGHLDDIWNDELATHIAAGTSAVEFRAKFRARALRVAEDLIQDN